MLKERVAVLRNIIIFTDLCVVSACFFAGYFVAGLLSRLYPLSLYMKLLFPFTALWGALLYFLGMYQSFRTKKISDILYTIAEISFIGVGGFGIILYFLKVEYVSRAFVFAVFAITALALSAEKFMMMSFFRYIRKQGYNIRHILVVGSGDRAGHFIGLIKSHAEWGLKILGLVDIDPKRKDEVVNGCRIIGSLDEIPAIIHNNVVDEVVFVVPRSWLDKIEDAVKFCDIEGLKISIAADYFDLKIAKAKSTELDGFPMVTFESAPNKVWHLLIKRLFDIVVSLIVLIVLSPVFLIVSAMIKATSKGPVFFRQERIGLNGRKFTLLKFRTMVEGAENKLNELLARNEMKGPVFKLTNDPRVTPIGRFLRKLSIDEFPQFWNVLTGDMSIIGPRPPLFSEVAKYDNWQRRRLSMRPGITCLWQVNGRNKITDFNEWMALDLNYIDHWSLSLDMKIFLKTIPVVLLGVGAK